MQLMRIVVTGASGNLGTSLLNELATDPSIDSIVGLARRLPSAQLPKVEWKQADVSHSPLEDIVRGADAVIHLAWLIQPSHKTAELEATNVLGSERVFRAAFEAGVTTIIHISSVGVYAPASKADRVDEHWSTEGIPSSSYSRHKAAAERRLWSLAESYPNTRCVALRPALMFKPESASEIQRYFLGPVITALQPKSRPLPVVPRISNLSVQGVHPDDVARAIRTVLHSDVDGAFNLAADPVLDVNTIASVAKAQTFPFPTPLLRQLVTLGWHTRLLPIDVGWLDMALSAPIMSCERARKELDWEAEMLATDAFEQLLEAMGRRADGVTPPLQR